jgi:hypothetical protein
VPSRDAFVDVALVVVVCCCVLWCAVLCCGAAFWCYWYVSHLPPHLKTGYHVYEEGGAPYDAMLNQMNIAGGANNNKVRHAQSLWSWAVADAVPVCLLTARSVLRHPAAGKGRQVQRACVCPRGHGLRRDVT